MIRQLFCSLLILICPYAYSQNETNHWFFDYGNGFDFTSGSPVCEAGGQTATTEGCSTISDSSGNLLFYTDGITVYDKTHATMTNGTGLTGNPTSNQSAIICAMPGSITKYYIFTNFSSFAYSIVDMSLSGGFGAIIIKNVTLQNGVQEEMTITGHANNKDFWAIRPQANSTNISVYLISSSGVGPAIVSTVGASSNGLYNSIKVSPNGKFICRSLYTDAWYLYKFNPCDGTISNEIKLKNSFYPYSCEYSLDSKILYISTVIDANPVIQYDLAAANIPASAFTIPGSSIEGALQMALNGKIYCKNRLANTISVINNPSILGAGCNFSQASINTCGKTVWWGFPSLAASFFRIKDTVIVTATNLCLNSSIQFSLDTSKHATYAVWDFGDGGTSAVISPSHTYAALGTYTVNVVMSSGCDTISGKKIITIVPNPIAAVIIGDVTVCPNSAAPIITFTGSNGTPPYTFTYTVNGGTNQTVTTSSGNSVTVPASTVASGLFIYSLVSIQDSANVCTKTQTGNATVTVSAIPTATITGDTTVCKGSASPDITFTGANATAPYTFTYTINNGGIQTITTSAGNSVNLPATTDSSGTFTYAIVSIQDSSLSNCLLPQSGTAILLVNPLPTATIAGTIAICKDATPPDIILTGAGGTAPYTFTYTINGVTQPTVFSIGNSVTISVPTFVAGAFTYALQSVKEAGLSGCSQPQSGSAVVTVSLLPTATVTGTTSVCRNETAPDITFTATNGTPPYTFTYTINGGTNQTITSVGNSVTVAVSASTEGVFTYDLISVQDGSSTPCAQTQSGSVIITVHPLPLADFSFPANGQCLNQMMNFYDSSTVTSGNIVSRSWNFLDGSPSDTTQNPAHTYSTSGSYNVSLIATTNNGCKDTIARTVTVHPLPDAQFTTNNVCDGFSVQFTDASTISSPGTVQSWVWNLGIAGPVITNQNPSHLYASMGSHNVQLLVFSDFGCKDSITKVITVNPNPIVNFTADYTTGCEPLCVSFQDLSSIPTGSNVQLTWDFGDGNPLIDQHCYTTDSVFSPQFFDVNLTVTSDSGCVTSLSKNNYITVNPKPVASFSVLPGTTTTLIDPVISITNLSIGANFWNWSFGDQGTSSLQHPPSYAYADTGSYIITLITSSQYNCLDTAYQTILIEPDFLFYIPNAFTPDRDGLNDTFNGTGIFVKQFELTIFDRWGNLIYKTDDITKPWDGSVKNGNEICPSDVYIYSFKLTDYKHNKRNFKGIVTLVR